MLSDAWIYKGWIREVKKYRKMWGLNWQSQNVCTEVCLPATTAGIFTLQPLCTIYAKLAATMLSKPQPSINPSSTYIEPGKQLHRMFGMLTTIVRIFFDKSIFFSYKITNIFEDRYLLFIPSL